MRVNAKGVFLGIRDGIPEMRKVGDGSIVSISSISGFVGLDFIDVGYNASKSAVRILTKSGAVQYPKDGLRENFVHPGLMSPMGYSIATANPEALKHIVAKAPTRREGRGEEVGYAVLFLASDKASHITGTELVVDGGFSAL